MKRNGADLINKQLTNFKTIDCPSCGHDKGWTVYEDDFGIKDHKVWCKNCGLIYKKEIWTENDNSRFYNEFYLSHYFKGGNDGFGGALSHFNFGQRRKRQVEYVRKYLTASKKPIEIGCSSGGVLDLITRINKNAVGIDIDKHSVDFAKEKGLDARVIDLFKIKEKYDFIWSSHVLEHVPNIKEFVYQISQIASENAIFALVVPNSEEMPEGPHVPHIFNYFSKNLIQIIEKNSRFRVKEIVKKKSVLFGGSDQFIIFDFSEKDEMFPEYTTNHEEYKKHIKNLSIRELMGIRSMYDDAPTAKERSGFLRMYKNKKKGVSKIPVKYWMVWSKLYIFFTLKWIKNT